MKDSPYEWMNYTPTISNEFIEQCENPNFEKLKKDIQIARAKDYLTKLCKKSPNLLGGR